MLRKVRPRVTYANVVSSLALFLVLTGGTAFAVVAANQVNSKSIVDGQVKNADLGTNSVRGSKVFDNSLSGADVKESSLGRVPSAANATKASTIAAPEAYREVGSPGQPPFAPGAGNQSSPNPAQLKFQTAGFYKDREG